MQEDIDAKMTEMIAARDDLRRVMDDMKASTPIGNITLTQIVINFHVYPIN